MRRRATKKAISMALAAAMAFSQVQVFAASSDIKGHWAESAITSWQDKGLITGYTDGTFKPDNSITRAEFASMVNKALGLTEKGDVPFSDVQSGSWYYDAISIAVKAGYCSGYEDGTFKPDATITRAEAAVMIALAKGLTQNTAAASGFADAANIPAWAKGYVGAVVSAGYMSGRPDGTFDATNTITRAEAVSSLDRAMGNTATTDKDVVVTEDDAVIDGQTIEGNLIIDKAVGEGEVYVKNSTVAGNIIVQGGGDDSIYLENVTVKGKVIVEKSGVRVQFEGTTETTDVEVKAVCELKGRNFEGKVGTITIAEELGTSEAVKVNVPAEAVVISAKASVYVNANVDKVTIASDAKDSKLEVTSSAKVGTVVADGKVAISGSGKVEKLEANADGITVSSSTTITKTEVADGVEKPSTPSTGGGGGGSSSGGNTSSNKVSVTLKDGENLQTILTKEKTSKNLTVKIPAGNYTVPQGGVLRYEGKGNLTINCDAGANFTEALTKSAVALTIDAPNVTGTVTVEGATTGISGLTFDAPTATVVASVPVATVEITNAKTLNVATGTTTTVTSSVDTVAVNVTNATEVTLSDDVATINVTKADKVTVNGEVANVDVNAETTIAGSGAITAINANAATTVTSTGNIGTVNAKADVTVDTAATNVSEVAVSGDADVTVNAKVDKVTVADGATTTITVKDGVTVATVDTKADITVAGAGTITNIYVTAEGSAEDKTTITAEGTIKVDTVTGDNTEINSDGLNTEEGGKVPTEVTGLTEITGYTPISAVTVESDEHLTTAELAAKKLPKTVELTYDTDGKVNANITGWTCESYDASSKEAQTFTATYEMSLGYKDEVEAITVKATVTLSVTQTEAETIKNITVGDREATVNESQPVQVNDGKYTVGAVSYDEGSKTYTIPVNGTKALVGESSSSTGSGKAGKYVGIGVTLEGISDITNVYYSASKDSGFEALTVDETLKTKLQNNSFIFYLDATGNNNENGAEVDGPVYRYIKLGEDGDVITLKFDYTPAEAKSDVVTLESVKVNDVAATDENGDGTYDVAISEEDFADVTTTDVVVTVTAGSNATVGEITKDDEASVEGTKVLFKFTVTAEDGTTTKEYTVNVTKAAVQEDVTTAGFTVSTGNNTITLTATEGSFDTTAGQTATNYTITTISSGLATNPDSVVVSGNTATLTFNTAATGEDTNVTVTVAAEAFEAGTIVETVTGAASTV